MNLFQALAIKVSVVRKYVLFVNESHLCVYLIKSNTKGDFRIKFVIVFYLSVPAVASMK